MSSSLAVNSLMQNMAAKPSIMDRTHFSGPSGHSHHSHSSKGSGKHSIALTALTLLSFLFFLNILQNCLQEHMDNMNPQQTIINVIQARIREAQNRKGEIEFFNSTISKEARNNPVNARTKPQMTQIPVKLRTSEKAVKP